MRRAGFSRSARLTSAAEYRNVFARSTRSTDAILTILSRPNGLEHSRLGLAIAKKHVPTAVTRNRVKRMLREYFRLHHTELQNLDIVVLSRKGLAQRSNQHIYQSLQRHWQRLSDQCEHC